MTFDLTEFWRRRQEWPRDTTSHTFLAAAFQRIGKCLFAEEWTGSEGSYSFMSPKVPASFRFARVRARIVDEATKGRLLTTARAKHGIEMSPIHQDMWALIRPDVLFQYCQIDLLRPTTSAGSGTDLRPVFVETQSLEGFLATLRGDPQLLPSSSPVSAAATRQQPREGPIPSQPLERPVRNFAKDGEAVYLQLSQPVEGKRPGRDSLAREMKTVFPSMTPELFRELRRKHKTPAGRQPKPKPG